MNVDIFSQINNAVFDLQQSDYQNYQRPLKQIARLLDHEELRKINENLVADVDLSAFLTASEKTGGSMIGSQILLWPDDHREYLALRLLVIRKAGEDSDFTFNFSHTFFAGSSSKVMTGIHNMTRQLIAPFVRDYKEYVLAQGNLEVKVARPMSKRVFVVHGHDGESREAVARFLVSIGLDPIILHEQANRGRTVIEKVEANSDVSFAVVLLTPDDLGRATADGEADLEPRARQNVLLELGYFIAKLGRAHVCALRRGSVVIPSDFAGVVWTEWDEAGAWKVSLARELKASGHDVDLNKLFS